VITEIAENNLTEIRRQLHPNCVVCCLGNKRGLQLDFKRADDGAMVGRFYCDKSFEGYPGLLHGGVIAALLDGAMTNCLFAAGHRAVTADFRVRFRHPVVTGQMATVRARISQSRPPVYELKAGIMQNGQLKTTGIGKFMEQSQSLYKSAP